jgi:NADH-quinone oxidoreductase subunit H
MTLGWQILGNLLGVGYFVIKVYLISVVFIWIRATLPRLRSDQLMQFAWLILIPVTLGTILMTGFLYLLMSMLRLSNLVFLLGLGVLNWLLLFGFIWLVGQATHTATRKAQAPALRARLRPTVFSARTRELVSQHEHKNKTVS